VSLTDQQSAETWGPARAGRGPRPEAERKRRPAAYAARRLDWLLLRRISAVRGLCGRACRRFR